MNIRTRGQAIAVTIDEVADMPREVIDRVLETRISFIPASPNTEYTTQELEWFAEYDTDLKAELSEAIIKPELYETGFATESYR